MSKFNYTTFSDGYDTLAVSKEKHTKEQAIEIAKVELESFKKPYYIAVGDGFVRHRAGMSGDNEPCVCWWLEYEEYKRSCPCWLFHKTKNKEEMFNKDYEYIEIKQIGGRTMKYFEVTEPYYALIKAISEDTVAEVGQLDVDNEEDFEINEVDKDYAWSKFSDSNVERDREYTTEELLEDFEAEEEALLLIDSSLI